ncbi:antitoxin MazE family protein [Rhizobium sp. S-51]|uniref:Antitoxin MazE family protein n=1 Tax=Rhizobium terricola TaxID=2728849 RepID=A0A7Y0B0D1_9HYPH|nr:antitoxin MazE family protein [Rhizobium terricola]NML76807.1 antitoxin MazE family protein [Rhizobium terricola]
MATSVSKRVEKRRQALRAMGLRPVQIWLPDTRRPGFVEECRRQSLAVAQSDRGDHDLQVLLDQALDDLAEEAD